MHLDDDIINLIQNSAEKKHSVFFSVDKLAIVFQTKILAIRNENLVLSNTVPPEYISDIAEAKRFMVQIQMIRFLTDAITSDGANIIFPLKNLKIVEDSRGAKRFPFENDEEVVLEVLNPFDEETLIKKSVIDISSTGISIKSPVDSKLYDPGVLFRNMKVIIDGKVYSKTDGRVIYKRLFLDQVGHSYYQIGLQFE